MPFRRALLPVTLLLVACGPDDEPDPADTEDPGLVETDVEETEPGETDDTDDTDDTVLPGLPEGLVALGTVTDVGLTVELFAPGPLQVGWNPVSFRLTNGMGELVREATLHQAPLMQMTEMSHACPFTDPPAVADAHGLFTGELVPIMASGMMGSWSDTLTIHTTDAGTDHTVVFEDLVVGETQRKKDLTVGDATWIFTLTPLATVEVGTVPFALTAHRKASMMSFPPIEDLTLGVEPWMPSMGHGAEGSVDPTHVANGRYEGVIGFNMGGAWEVTVHVTQGEAPLGDVVFAFEL